MRFEKNQPISTNYSKNYQKLRKVSLEKKNKKESGKTFPFTLLSQDFPIKINCI